MDEFFFLSIAPYVLSAVLTGMISYVFFKKIKGARKRFVNLGNIYIVLQLLLWISMIKGFILEEDDPYSRVDFKTSIYSDYLTSEENSYNFYCINSLGFYHAFTCRPYYYFLNIYRQSQGMSSKSYVENLKKEKKIELHNDYEQSVYDNILKCNENPDFRKKYCQEGLDMAYTARKYGNLPRDTYLKIYDQIKMNMETMKCQDMKVLTQRYDFEFFLYDELSKNSKKYKEGYNLIFKNILGQCFRGECLYLCERLRKYSSGSEIEQYGIRLIYHSILTKRVDPDKWRTEYISYLNTLINKYGINKFEDFYSLVKRVYPDRLLLINLDLRNDKDFWKKVYNEKI